MMAGLEQRSREPRHRRLLTSLIAAVVAVVVAVPIGVTVLLRSGVGGGSHAATTSVLDLHMFTATTGWAWAGGSQILHTSSGVAHWTIVPPPVGDFVIVGVAWAGSESARILAAPASSLNNLERPYTLTPWLTDDAGAHWTKGQTFTVLLEAGQDPTTSSDLDFVDPLHGWFFDAQNLSVGAPMFIYRTVDGGMHWSLVETTPANGVARRGALPVGCAAYGMTFINATTGWVGGQCGQATLFDVTHDGGTTWVPQTIGCIDCAFYPPQFTSPLDGSAYGGSGGYGLFVTNDGGRTWNARGQPPGNWPDFVDAHHGFTLGLTGNNNPSVILWTTSDGGVTWGQAPHGAIHGNGPQETSQLDFITPRFGWAVSVYITSGGGLLRGGQTPFPTPPPELWQTTDGGVSWSQITPTFTASK